MSVFTALMFEKEFSNLADKMEFSQFDSEDESQIDELKGKIILSKFDNDKKIKLVKRLEELEAKNAKVNKRQGGGSRRKTRRKKSRRVKRKSRR